jgi:hypothetical protein
MTRKWIDKQWKEPKRFLYKGYGLTVWKWCGAWFPTWIVFLGSDVLFGYDIFHNGRGFKIRIKRIFILHVCTHGMIRWDYKKGLIKLKIGNFKYQY